MKSKKCFIKINIKLEKQKVKWVRQAQEKEGDYYFNGTCYITKGVETELAKEEIEAILRNLFDFISKKDGIDYLQVFVRESDGKKIFVIDQLSKSMMESGGYTPEQIEEYNCFTILFSSEY